MAIIHYHQDIELPSEEEAKILEKNLRLSAPFGVIRTGNKVRMMWFDHDDYNKMTSHIIDCSLDLVML